MPYTRNTRIKKTTKAHSVEFEAQVEYKYPFLPFTKWIEIDLADYSNFWSWMFCDDKDGSIPWQASRDCLHKEELENVRGLEWAQALIDRYHELYDEYEHKPVVEYIKYP